MTYFSIVILQETVVYTVACKRDFEFDSWSDVVITFNLNQTECLENQTTFGAISVE